MRIGYRLRAVGVAVAALAAILLAAPAAAEPGPSAGNRPGAESAVGAPSIMAADRSCTVTNQWSCKITTPIWFNSNSSVNLATAGIPSTTASSIVSKPTAYSWYYEDFEDGGDHSWWWNSWVAGNYVFELKCPHSCQGATLYVTRH
jgi:hypothetical protein